MRNDWLKDMIAGPGPVPSRICLGTAAYGTGVSREAAFAVMDAYLAAGGNFLDTAHIYGAWAPDRAGASEKTVGEWLRSRGARERIVLATKGGHPPLDRMDQKRLSRQDLENDLSESLQRLGVGHIDLYWLHRDDPSRPVADILETLTSFVADGRIRAYGVSNWTVERLEALRNCARESALPLPAASQIQYSLAERPERRRGRGDTLSCDEPTRRWHESTGVPVCAYTAQAQGYFGSANVEWAKSGFQGEAPVGGFDSPTNRRRLLRAIELAGQKGCTANQVALAYLLCQRARVVPIVSTSKVEHLNEAMAAVRVRLTVEECCALISEDA